MQAAFQQDAPSPARAIAIVVEDAGEIVAFSIIQTIVHLEPVWVDSDQRNSTALLHMLNYIEDQGLAPNFFISSTSNPRVAHLMEAKGMVNFPDQKIFKWTRSKNE